MDHPSPIRRGIADILPLAAPGVPFGLIVGIAIAESPIDNWLGFLSTPLIFGGAAQLTLITLLASGAVAAAAVAAALVVNARHLMYSFAMAPRFAAQPRWFRWVGSYSLLDQTFAIVTTIPEDADPQWFRRYYGAASIMIGTIWHIAVAIGLLAGGGLPDAWRFEFAVPILFLSLVLIALERRPAVVAAVVGFSVAIIAGPLPSRLGILVGGLAGVVAGTFIGRNDE